MKTSLIYMVAVLLSTLACAQKPRTNDIPITVNDDYEYEVIVPDLVNPWGMVVLPDESMLITEKSGALLHFKNDEIIKIKNVPEVVSRGQGGLLDIRLHPDYASNGWIYFTYSSSEGEGDGAMTALMRAKLLNGRLEQKEVLYKGSPNTRKGQHFGSRVRFDNKGYVFFSIGERGARDVNPQDITRDGGKIYRLHDDGRIPTDNPFVGKSNAKKAIYSYGHRNPQGMVFHPVDGTLWIHEHGPKGGDEINLPKAGLNYGWPVISYGVNYSGTSFTEITSKEGMEQPLYYWVPSIAPSGMTFAFKTGDKHLEGNLLIGSLKFGYLEHVILKDFKVVAREKLLEDVGRVRNVINHKGTIYLGVEGKGILKLVKK